MSCAPLKSLLGGLFALLCMLAAAPALSHTKSESHTVWQIVGKTVHLTFTMPVVEANRLAINGVLPPPNSRISAYLTAHLAVSSKTASCPARGPARAVAATAQFWRFRVTFRCFGCGWAAAALLGILRARALACHLRTD